MTNSHKHVTPKRFVLEVGSDGRITIKHGTEVVFQQPQPMASILRWLENHSNIRNHPEEPLRRDDAFLWMLCDDDTDLKRIWGSYEKIHRKGRYNDGDLKEMGRFLFDKLIGEEEEWKKILDKAGSGGDAAAVELAFQFDKSLLDLHRFNLELMCRGDVFLARERVAFTRLVERSDKEEPTPFPRPPKVLFVIGSSYTDEQVRPGADYFGLLRHLEARGHTIHSRLLRLASPPEIRDAVENFGPDLVHFICHGGVGADPEDNTRGFLELQTENKKDSAPRFAADLLEYLKAGGRLPPIVVLSACHSASLPTSGAPQSGSLASELVAGGVPMVVGMGGSISDVACRQFSRRFGEAVLAGESLVAATAEGRWTAFVDRTPETIDWALPTLFMGADVDAGFVPVEQKEGDEDPGVVLKTRRDVYGIPDYPVFCARYKFFEHFYRLFSTSGSPNRVLVIRTKGTTPGIGRKRLLQELAAQALREGHVPILLTFRKSASVPTNLTRLAVAFIEAVDKAREAFRLPPRLDGTLLRRLLRARPYDDLEMELEESDPRDVLADILAHFEGIDDVLTPRQIRAGMYNELRAVLKELRQPPGRIGKQGRAVVLLNRVHDYGDAIRPLFSELIDNFGLGRQDEPVPVILCYSKADLSDATVKHETEGKGIRWLQEELEPFRADGEDMLAYQQVMLNLRPEDPEAQRLWANVRNNSEEIEGDVPAFAFNPRATETIVKYCTEKLRREIAGIPDLLDKDEMYSFIEVGMGYPPFKTTADDRRFLIPADDETKLRKLRENQ